jgi:hypothetical protein
VVLSTFPGFDDLTANFVLTPNQFLDLCVPHCSRGVVRIVAYLLRQTLGWLDKQGQPLHEQVNVSYTQLIQRAGVSRGALPTALAEAERLGFIRCVRPGQPKRAGQAAVAALYELKWSDSHTHSLDDFEGFYAGSGHRTPVPNQFFDVVVPHEPLAVVKVVGSVLRHTVGFENRYGGRRQEAPLSYTRISTHARLARSTLASAMAHALNHRYIRRVSTGYLRPGTSEFEASVYGVRWASDEPDEAIGSKIEPGPSIYRFKNRTGKKPPERFRNRTGIGSEIKNNLKNNSNSLLLLSRF